MVGLLPLLGVALTSPPVQGVVSRALGVVGRLSVKAGLALWRAADAGLRFFGTSGSRLADRLTAAGRRIAGRAASLAADPPARLLLDACGSSLQLVGPLSRGVLVHRLLGRLVSPRWLRTVLELAVAPVLLDWRLARSIRAWLEAALRRVAGDHHPVTEAVISRVGDDPVQAPQGAAVSASPANAAPAPLPVAEHLVAPADNRAGRRAAQRQEAQARRARPTR